MTDIVERLRNNNWSGNIADDITRWADSRSEAADTITTLRAEVAALREGLAAINSLGGNVDHDKPGGPNDSAMRGGLFMTAKKIAQSLIEEQQP